MSPLLVRRYRAERLLRDEFEALRANVLARVARRLRACGAHPDAGDLEACYSQAWQGLYAAVLEGQRIDDAASWLTLVSYRRAIDEHRSRGRLVCESFDAAGEEVALTGATPTHRERPASEQDIAARLDDRVRLRQLFEALRGRLNAREQQAATLCYLQGLSRAQAAARMGVSEPRMRKLMDGGGPRSPGVAAKVGALVQTIGAGGWCEEQGSLMRGLAYGILDPDGERHRLALLHRDACPSCRAYVLSLRGLAAVLPPVPVLWLGTGALAGAAGGGTGVAVAGGATGSSGASSSAGAGSLGGLGGGTLSASGAAGVGAAGGSWWLAGPLGAKLAVGCLVALGVGAGCVALDGPSGHAAGHAHRSHVRHPALARAANASSGAAAPLGSSPAPSVDAPAGAAAQANARPRATAATRANREFGPEQPAGSAASTKLRSPAARAASAMTSERSPQQPPDEGEPRGRPSAGTTSSGAVPAAQREFAPG